MRPNISPARPAVALPLAAGAVDIDDARELRLRFDREGRFTILRVKLHEDEPSRPPSWGCLALPLERLPTVIRDLQAALDLARSLGLVGGEP